MSAIFKETLLKWNNAGKSFDLQDYAESMDLFQEIDDVSKIQFNCGVLSMHLRDSNGAVDSFSRAIELDYYSAVAYLQRGAVLYMNLDYEGALEDYQDSYERMRRNTYIDYTQLGLDYMLHECYLILNIALCFISLGDLDRGLRYTQKAMDSAKNSKMRPNTRKIEEAIKAQEAAGRSVVPYLCPLTNIFRPQADNIKNADKVDYLGKASVVIGADDKDDFAGFSGHLQKKVTLGRNYRAKKTDLPPAAPRPNVERNNSAPERLNERNNNIIDARPPLLQRSKTTTAGPPHTFDPPPSIKRRGSSTNWTRNETTPAFIDLSRVRNAGQIHRDGPSGGDSAGSGGGGRGGIFTDDLSPIVQSRAVRPPMVRKGSDPFESDELGGRSPFVRKEGTASPRVQRSAEPALFAVGSPKEKGSAASSASSNRGDMLRVKAYFNGCRIIAVSLEVSYSELRDAICKKFKNPDIVIQYMDEEGKKTLMSNDDDLAEALFLSTSSKLDVWCFVKGSL